MKEYLRVRAEVDLDCVYSNVLSMKRAVDSAARGVRLCAVIKADGYGHGAVPVAKAIDHLVWGYATATVEEAVQLRNHGIEKPVLVLGRVDSSDYEECIRLGIRVLLCEKSDIYGMEEAVRKYRSSLGTDGAVLKVHVKLDTGMGRLGFLCQNEESIRESEADIERLLESSYIYAEGCVMHFSRADECDKTFARLQYERFCRVIRDLKDAGISFELCHCDNSAGIVDLPEYGMDMVRMGIALYGLYPSDEVDKSRVKLKPALSLKSHLSFVKTVPAGTCVGYGSSYVTDSSMRIGTVPVGYADGYPRLLSNKGYVLIMGKRVPVVGRVCMDQFMVDLSVVPDAHENTEVTLIGRDGDEELSADEVAGWAQTISYEVLCGISKRVPRVYFRNNQRIGTKDSEGDIYKDFL